MGEDHPGPMPDPLRDFGTVVLIDRTTRATADLLELVLEPAIAEEWLGRPPDVVANGVISWGRVTAEQILQLLDLCGDEHGRPQWGELLVKHTARDLFISLVWRTKE